MASTIPDLPLWGWNLIIAMLRHEELHGENDTCLNGVLKAVPVDVRDQAAAISTYIQKANGHQVADQAEQTFGKIIDGFFGSHTDEPKPEPEDAP